MNQRNALIRYLEKLQHESQQTIEITKLMVQFNLTYVEVVLTIMEWMRSRDNIVSSA